MQRDGTLLTAIAATGLLVLAGCQQSGPEVVPVVGRLTRGGKPVPNMVVWFQPTEGRPSWASTDGEGRFTLNYSRSIDGARVGKHKVWVQYNPRPLDAAEEIAIQQGRKRPPAPPAGLADILERYGDGASSSLEVEIDEAQTDLEIKLD